MLFDPGLHSILEPVLKRQAVLLLTTLLTVASVGHAQTPEGSDVIATSDSVVAADEPDVSSNSFVERVQAFDRSLFRQIYSIDNRAFRSFVFISDATSYRAFYGSVPTALIYSSLDGNGDWSDVYRLALSELVAVGASLQLQKAFERDRPPHELAGTGIRVRSQEGESVGDITYSFPSGHAAAAAALVTSWSLSYPKWYVIAPGAVWASSVALSRVWRGRHFPGDVVAGVLFGAAVATTVHLMDPLITPGFLKSDAAPVAPRFYVAIPIK